MQPIDNARLRAAMVDDQIAGRGLRAGEVLVAMRADPPADLIVLGTHGRRGVGRWLLRSDAERIVRSTPVPILLVRAGDLIAREGGEP